MPDSARERELTVLLADELLPVIHQASTINGLQAMHRDGRLNQAGLRRQALDALT
jgi:hypothetical protein